MFSSIVLPPVAELQWDLSHLLTTGVLLVTRPGLGGDFNGDGTDDAADYVAWRKGLATGAYTQADYNTWRQNFGATAAGAAAVAQSPPQSSVPEPNGLQLTVLMIAALGWRRRDSPDVMA
jgi:hypothetical protein